MGTIYLDLLGSQIRFYEGKKYRTRVIEAGEGDLLILMHGGGGHAEAYSRNIQRLSQHFRVMAIDFIWHGFSSKPPFRDGNWLAQFTEQILDLMDALGVDQAYIEGESLGGWICLDMAINHSKRVKKVILNTAWGMKFKPGTVREQAQDMNALRETSIRALENPSPETLRRRLEWLMASPDRVTDELVEVRYRIWSRPDTRQALTEYYKRLFSEETDRYLFREEDIARITVPTLVLWTDKNPFHGPDAGERLAQLIPGAQYYLMRDAGHWPQWEHPEEHDEVVIRFLKG
jgi:pimeloyl-ACP methyl ester carboxylesterase